MILIAFAPNINKDTTKKANQLDLAGEPLENLLDTGFKPSNRKKPELTIQSENEREDTQISGHPLDKLKNLFEVLQEELANKRLARKESLELEALIDLNNLILKNLANHIITEPLKDLIVSAVTQQKEVLAEYLKEDSQTKLSKEKQEIKTTINELEQNLNLIVEQTTRASNSVHQAVVSEVILDPTAFSFHERSTLVTATKERAQAEAQAKIEINQQREDARKIAELRVLREYVARLDNDELRINFVSALYQQRKDPAVLTIVTDVLSKEQQRTTVNKKNAPAELSLAS